MEKSLNEKSIVLYDTNFSFSKLKEYNKNTIIITFDFDSHKVLSENNIEHITSDSLLETTDYYEIWQNSWSTLDFDDLMNDIKTNKKENNYETVSLIVSKYPLRIDCLEYFLKNSS